MLNRFPAVLLECFPKKRGKGYLLTVVSALGFLEKIHTLYDLSGLCSDGYGYWLTVEHRTIPGAPSSAGYYILKNKPEQIELFLDSNPSRANSFNTVITNWMFFTDQAPVFTNRKSTYISEMQKVIAKFKTDPDRYKKYDETEVWGRIKELKADIKAAPGKNRDASELGFSPTFKKSEEPEKKEKEQSAVHDINADIQGIVDSVQNRNYRTKAKYLTVGELKDSQLTQVMEKAAVPGFGSNRFRKTGIEVFIDSTTLQVAIKERHIAEIFLYFAVITFMKKAESYPNTTVGQLLPPLEAFLAHKRLKKTGKALLHRLYRLKLIDLSGKPGKAWDITNDTVVSVRTQQEYVRKFESRWNAKQLNCLDTRKSMVNQNMVIDEKRVVKRADLLKEAPHGSWEGKKALKTTFRPYFDIFAFKTAKLDTGFIHLLNAGKSAMLSWLYEMVITSWDYPVCRTRVQGNLLISRSSQKVLERNNGHLKKRYNFMEIPERMLNQMSQPVAFMIRSKASERGRFKYTTNGRILRQEGNSFRSDRVNWKSSTECSRLRLSPRRIKQWNAVKPVFHVSDEHGNRRTVSKYATYKPVDKRLINGQSLPTTYTGKKTVVKTGHFFALFKDGIMVPTTNPNNWAGFDPLMELDRFNGDQLMPSTPTFHEPPGWQREVQFWQPESKRPTGDPASVQRRGNERMSNCYMAEKKLQAKHNSSRSVL